MTKKITTVLAIALLAVFPMAFAVYGNEASPCKNAVAVELILPQAHSDCTLAMTRASYLVKEIATYFLLNNFASPIHYHGYSQYIPIDVYQNHHCCWNPTIHRENDTRLAWIGEHLYRVHYSWVQCFTCTAVHSMDVIIYRIGIGQLYIRFED